MCMLGSQGYTSTADERNAEQVDAENPAMTLRLTIDILWRRVSDPGRCV